MPLASSWRVSHRCLPACPPVCARVLLIPSQCSDYKSLCMRAGVRLARASSSAGEREEREGAKGGDGSPTPRDATAAATAATPARMNPVLTRMATAAEELVDELEHRGGRRERNRPARPMHESLTKFVLAMRTSD